jgi:hypothetical protein
VTEIKGLELPQSGDYVIVFARLAEQQMPSSALALILQAQKEGIPWLTIEISNEEKRGGRNWDEIKIIFPDGVSRPLPPEAPTVRASEIELTIEGETPLTIKCLLPIEIEVQSDAPNAALTVRVPNSAGFSRSAYNFLVSRKDDNPLGNGRMRVDTLLRPGQSDDVVLRVVDFSGAYSQQWEQRPGSNLWPTFDQRRLVLHLLYDRTTIDAEFWTTALAATDDPLILQGGDEVFAAVPHHNPQTWNMRWRTSLAQAMAATAEELHHDSSFCLWWFADKPRDGIAQGSLPVIHGPEPFGCVGEYGVEGLAKELGAASFDYVSGLDLFDAADDALIEIVDSIKHNRTNRQHAILIVGDSPPPPQDTEDELWKYLLEKPLRTNARCSPRFRQALQELKSAKAPVAWLYLRVAHPPADTPNRQFLKDFQAFRTLKERTLEALRQTHIDGLIVEGCESPAELEQSLRRLFSRIKYGRPKVPAFQVIQVH